MYRQSASVRATHLKYQGKSMEQRFLRENLRLKLPSSVKRFYNNGHKFNVPKPFLTRIIFKAFKKNVSLFRRFWSLQHSLGLSDTPTDSGLRRWFDFVLTWKQELFSGRRQSTLLVPAQSFSELDVLSVDGTKNPHPTSHQNTNSGDVERKRFIEI